MNLAYGTLFLIVLLANGGVNISFIEEREIFRMKHLSFPLFHPPSFSSLGLQSPPPLEKHGLFVFIRDGQRSNAEPFGGECRSTHKASALNFPSITCKAPI